MQRKTHLVHQFYRGIKTPRVAAKEFSNKLVQYNWRRGMCKENAFFPHTTDLLLQFSAEIVDLLTHHILYKTTGILESLD